MPASARDLGFATPVVCCGAPGVPAAGPSGASAHLRAVADALGARALVTPRHHDRRGVAETDPGTSRFHVTGVPGWPSWLGRWRDQVEILAGRRVADAVVALAPDLVWERHALYADVGLRVHAATGTPWILEVNAPPAMERARWEDLRDPAHAAAWERDVVSAAPRVIAVSRWLADWAVSLGAPDVRWVPNGARTRPGDRARARAALGIPDDVVVLGYLGSARTWHGVDRVASLLDALPDARALVVGEAVVPHPRAHHVGVVRETAVPDLVAAMDVGLAPYTDDAPPWLCPLKILHYRAQGVPVLATNVGDVGLLLAREAPQRIGANGTRDRRREAAPEGPPPGRVLPRWSLPDAVDAVRTLAGSGPTRWVRSWHDVIAEALA